MRCWCAPTDLGYGLASCVRCEPRTSTATSIVCACGFTKAGGVHTLRHCYATHLLESGVDLHCISQWLGHGDVSTTARYLHLAQPGVSGARMQPLQLLESLPKLSG